MKAHLIFLFIFFKMSAAEAPVYQNFWVIWNIGQGQWVTHITPDECLHYDAGGEPGAFKRIRTELIRNCGRKVNRLLLSHWDMDHYLHIPFLAKTFPRLCWQVRPAFGITKPSAQKIMNLKIKNCEGFNTHESLLWTPSGFRTTNESSAVFLSEQVLLPGDSPTTQEVMWAQNRPGLQNVKVLVLGHHGSRSSSGKDLLLQLRQLKWAVASARFVKYRHPHYQTLQRLFNRDIPVLRTEDWGNIRFETGF